ELHHWEPGPIRIPSFRQKLFGLIRVVVVHLQIGVVAGHTRGQHSGSWNTAHLGDLPHDLLFVYGILEGPANTHIVERFKPRVKANEEETEGRFTEALVLVVLRVGTDLFCLGAWDRRLFQIPFQKLVKRLLKRRTDLEDHSVEKWPALVVPVVGLQNDLFVW